MSTLAIAAIIIGLALATEQYFDTVRTHREWAANDASFWRRTGRKFILINQYLIMIIGFGFIATGIVVLFVM